MKKRLYRSRSDRMLGGVCGGLAEYFDIDPTIVRLVAVLTVFLNGLGLVAYVVMAIVVPVEGSKRAAPTDIIKDNVEEMKETATKLGAESVLPLSTKKKKSQKRRKNAQQQRKLVTAVATSSASSLLSWAYSSCSAALACLIGFAGGLSGLSFS